MLITTLLREYLTLIPFEHRPVLHSKEPQRRAQEAYIFLAHRGWAMENTPSVLLTCDERNEKLARYKLVEELDKLNGVNRGM